MLGVPMPAGRCALIAGRSRPLDMRRPSLGCAAPRAPGSVCHLPDFGPESLLALLRSADLAGLLLRSRDGAPPGLNCRYASWALSGPLVGVLLGTSPESLGALGALAPRGGGARWPPRMGSGALVRFVGSGFAGIRAGLCAGKAQCG